MRVSRPVHGLGSRKEKVCCAGSLKYGGTSLDRLIRWMQTAMDLLICHPWLLAGGQHVGWCWPIFWGAAFLRYTMTFVKVALLYLREAFCDHRFVAAVLTGNFVILLAVAWLLMQWYPSIRFCNWACCSSCWCHEPTGSSRPANWAATMCLARSRWRHAHQSVVAVLSVPTSELAVGGQRNLLLLGLSSVTTGLSWMFYNKALKAGGAATVALTRAA